MEITVKTIAFAIIALALTGGAASAQQGYWTNEGSIYGGRTTQQWHDTSNSGPIYQPPVNQYQQQNRGFTCTTYGNQTICN
jgi:hypothetical protein